MWTRLKMFCIPFVKLACKPNQVDKPKSYHYQWLFLSLLQHQIYLLEAVEHHHLPQLPSIQHYNAPCIIYDEDIILNTMYIFNHLCLSFRVNKQRITYSGIIGVVCTFGCTTSPIANMPPPLDPSKQCEKTFLTFLAEASCESIEEFACPNPSIPSSACSDEPNSPDCWDPHLSWIKDNTKYKRINKLSYHS